MKYLTDREAKTGPLGRECLPIRRGVGASTAARVALSEWLPKGGDVGESRTSLSIMVVTE
ncbi:MAG TPA: hypothetical protein VHD36_17590 [Pirellulales bacterium]|nr:hypothetical protein [Pirellulales bacterium]